MNSVFVTVGSTKFDTLIDAILKPAFLQTLYERGCKRLVIQHGDYNNSDALSLARSWSKFSIDCFSYKPSIVKEIDNADWVIGHAGAGTVIESLRSGKALVIVPNDTLMGNHQQELAEEITSRNWAFLATPANLEATLSTANRAKLEIFPERKAAMFRDFMWNLLEDTAQ